MTKSMPEDFEIKEFLVEHQSEVKNMCLTEYDEAETMQMFKEEGREERDTQKIEEMLSRGKTVEEIVDFCGYPYEQVKSVEEDLLGTTI